MYLPRPSAAIHHMMDGRNCTGRTISLLNDRAGDVVPHPSTIHHYRVASPLSHAHRPASGAGFRSSCASPPASPLSPLYTPTLIRSGSSCDSRACHTPSPLTPSSTTFQFAALHHYHHHSSDNHSAAQQYYRLAAPEPADKMDDLTGHPALYPPIPDAAAAAYPMHLPALPLPPRQQPHSLMQPAPLHRASTSPASEPSRVSTHSATSNAKPQPKKNHYPCPMAKQYACADFFTTSGHAARHAKKHTGKKDAFCPECNKAFTRKDNMEQHRRTHQTGRGASRSATTLVDETKIKKSTKPPAKKAHVKTEPQLEAAVEHHLAQQQQLADAHMIAHTTTLPTQQTMLTHNLLDQSMMMPPGCGPYFITNNGMDAIPVASLPMAMPDLSGRPQLQRSSYGMNNLEYVAPTAPMTMSEEAMHYSYPSPGLSNGLNSLALAASEHQRLSRGQGNSQSPMHSHSPSSSSGRTP